MSICMHQICQLSIGSLWFYGCIPIITGEKPEERTCFAGTALTSFPASFGNDVTEIDTNYPKPRPVYAVKISDNSDSPFLSYNIFCNIKKGPLLQRTRGFSKNNRFILSKVITLLGYLQSIKILRKRVENTQ